MKIFHRKENEWEKELARAQKEELPEFLREDGAKDWRQEEGDFAEWDEKDSNTEAKTEISLEPHKPGAVKISPDVLSDAEEDEEEDEEKITPSELEESDIPWLLPCTPPCPPEFSEQNMEQTIPGSVAEPEKKSHFSTPLVPLLLITFALVAVGLMISYFTQDSSVVPSQPEIAWVQMAYEQKNAIYQMDETGEYLYTLPYGEDQVKAYFADYGYTEAAELQTDKGTLMFNKGNESKTVTRKQSVTTGDWPYEVWQIHRVS